MNEVRLKVVPIWKFILFDIITLGAYHLYWSYKTWHYIKEKNKLDLDPFWRTFFMLFSSGTLYYYICGFNRKQIKITVLSSSLIGISYFILSLLSKKFLFLYLLAYIPLCFIVNELNIYCSNIDHDALKIKKLSTKELVTFATIFSLLIFTYTGLSLMSIL